MGLIIFQNRYVSHFIRRYVFSKQKRNYNTTEQKAKIVQKKKNNNKYHIQNVNELFTTKLAIVGLLRLVGRYPKFLHHGA